MKDRVYSFRSLPLSGLGFFHRFGLGGFGVSLYVALGGEFPRDGASGDVTGRTFGSHMNTSISIDSGKKRSDEQNLSLL